MTSTNDEKEVKSNQSSGPKGKTYYIELYKSLEAHLSGEAGLHDRTQHLCTAWRRIHSLCQHSTPNTHPYLRSWIQKHTVKLVLQTEWWQSPENKDEQSSLEQAIDAFIEDCQTAASSRNGVVLPWESQLIERAEWFKSNLADPWAHPVLRVLLDPRGTEPTDEEVLEWLKEERGFVFVARLRQLAASKCDDLALALATAVMNRVRNTTTFLPDAEQCKETSDNPKPVPKSPFAETLKNEADFTKDVWELLIDIEFVLLHKGDKRSRCIELAKQTPLRTGGQLVERLENRLETSSREKKKEKLWKNAKDVATLIAQVIIARCMVVSVCADVCNRVLRRCSRALTRLLPPAKLPAAANALAAPAATAKHLHALAASVDAESKQDMKPFVCVLYVRAITAGMNELERLKLKTEKESEARSMESTLASWFVHLGSLLCASNRFNCECILTAFSIHPSAEMYEMIEKAPTLPPVNVDAQDSKEASTSEFGSWANDSRSQTNLVKTSETLNMKQTQHQANVLSTAILAEGEALGLDPDLCQDIAVLLSGPRVKTLSWDMDRKFLLENCQSYMDRTHGGTRALTTELKFLNLDPREFEHLPEEEDDENDIYYGIEKGYEHLVEFQEPSIWNEDIIKINETTDTAISGSDDSLTFLNMRKKKQSKKLSITSEEESDPLSSSTVLKIEKKERLHSKERRKHSKKKPVDPLRFDECLEARIKLKKERKEKHLKKLEKEKSNTVNTNFTDVDILKSGPVTDSDYDSQGKSSFHSNSEVNEDIFDALCSHINELKSPKNIQDKRVNSSNTEHLLPNDSVTISRTNSSVVTESENRKNNISLANNISRPVHKPVVKSVSEEVKRNLTRLIGERANLGVPKLLQPIQNNEYKMPIAIARPSAPIIPTQINPKKIAIPEMEIPQSFIEKRVESAPANLVITNDLCSSKYKEILTVKNIPQPENNMGASRQPLTVKELIIKQQRTKKISETACQSNFKDFLRELKETINAGTGSESTWVNRHKEVLRPIIRVPPVIPNYKSELKTPQSAKLIQNKDNTLNTFSRLSYMHKNKIDKKHVTQDVIEHRSNYIQQHSVREQHLDQLLTEHKETKMKYLYPNLEVTKVEKKNTVVDLNTKMEQKLINQNRNPILTNLLQVSSQMNLDRESSLPSSVSTGLSEEDHIDLLHLLRQKNKMNSPLQPSEESNNPLNNKSSYGMKKPMNDSRQFNVSMEGNVPKQKHIKEVFAPCHDIHDHHHHVCDINKSPLSSVEDKKPQPEWEEVMNKLIAQKTPSRGPTALELTLNKGQRTCESLRNQRIKKNSISTKTNFEGDYKNKSADARQYEVISKSQRGTVVNPVITTNNFIKTGGVPVRETTYDNSSLQLNINKQPTVSTSVDNKLKTSNHMQGQFTKSQNINLPKKLERTESKRISIEVQKRQFTYTSPKQDDPFISGLPNSDYDLLEELMDDELRKEIGELSDEDFSISANSSKDMKNIKENELIPKSLCDKLKITKAVIITPAKNNSKRDYDSIIQRNKQANNPKPFEGTQPQQNTIHPALARLEKNDTSRSLNISQAQHKSLTGISNQVFERVDKNGASRSFERFQSQQKLVTKVIHPVPEKSEKNEIAKSMDLSQSPPKNLVNMVKPAIEKTLNSATPKLVEQGLPGNILINKTVSNEYSAVKAMESNILNVPESSVFLIPPRTLPNVLLVGSNVYNTYSTVQTQVARNNISSNIFLDQPNVSLYQSTHFVTPLINPVIIGDVISKSTPILKQVATKSIAGTETHELSPNSSSETVKSAFAERAVTSNVDIDSPIKSEKEANETQSNKYCERKILSQVQTNSEDNDLAKIRRQKNSIENTLKEEKDKERLLNKRMSIINRKIYHGHNNNPIPLNYTPLKPTIDNRDTNTNSTEVDQEKESISNPDASVPQIDAKQQDIGNLVINDVSEQIAIDSKENNSSTTCRRILLRSYNKIQPKLMSTVVVPKEASGRKTKVRLKVDFTNKVKDGLVSSDKVVQQKNISARKTVKRLNKSTKNRKTTFKKKTKQNPQPNCEYQINKKDPNVLKSEMKLDRVIYDPVYNKTEVDTLERSIPKIVDSIEKDIKEQFVSEDTSEVKEFNKMNNSQSKKVDKIVIRKVNAHKHEIASMNNSSIILQDKEKSAFVLETKQCVEGISLVSPDTRRSDIEKIKHLLKSNIKQTTSSKIIPVKKAKESSNKTDENCITSEYRKSNETKNCSTESTKIGEISNNQKTIYTNKIDSNGLKEPQNISKRAAKEFSIKTNGMAFTPVDKGEYKDYNSDIVSSTKGSPKNSIGSKKITLTKMEKECSISHGKNINAELIEKSKETNNTDELKTNNDEPKKFTPDSGNMNYQLKLNDTEAAYAITGLKNKTFNKNKHSSNIDVITKGLDSNVDTKQLLNLNTIECKEATVKEVNIVRPVKICNKTNLTAKLTVDAQSQNQTVTSNRDSVHTKQSVNDKNVEFRETALTGTGSPKRTNKVSLFSSKVLSGAKKIDNSDCTNEARNSTISSDIATKSAGSTTETKSDNMLFTSDHELNNTKFDKHDSAEKDNIFIERVKNRSLNDPNKQQFRVKLPNKRTFIATITGMHVDVNTLFTHPAFKSVLLSNITENQKYTFNVKQALTVHADDRSKVETRIEEVSLSTKINKPSIVETVSLLSDDEDDVPDFCFETEFGKYKVKNINEIEFKKHQEKFDKKCHVKLERKKSISNPASVLNQNLVSSDVIEIDDSSNDSINKVPQLNEDIDTLKDLLIRELCVDPGTNCKADNIRRLSDPVITKTAKCKECYVRLTNCDNLLKKYEQSEISNKPIITKMDGMNSLSNVAPTDISYNTSNDSDIQICTLNIQNIDEGDMPVLSRSGSFSILNDFTLYDIETSTTKPPENSDNIELERSSPVMEVYGIIAKLSVQNEVEKDKTQYNNFFEPVKCESDLFQTKRRLRELEYQKTSNDCDNNKLLIGREITFDVPRLTTLMLLFFQTYNFVKYLKPTNAPEPYGFQNRASTLKRKFKPNDKSHSSKVAKNTQYTEESYVENLEKEHVKDDITINVALFKSILSDSTKNTINVACSTKQIQISSNEFENRLESENVRNSTGDVSSTSNENANITDVTYILEPSRECSSNDNNVSKEIDKTAAKSNFMAIDIIEQEINEHQNNNEILNQIINLCANDITPSITINNSKNSSASINSVFSEECFDCKSNVVQDEKNNYLERADICSISAKEETLNIKNVSQQECTATESGSNKEHSGSINNTVYWTNPKIVETALPSIETNNQCLKSEKEIHLRQNVTCTSETSIFKIHTSKGQTSEYEELDIISTSMQLNTEPAGDQEKNKVFFLKSWNENDHDIEENLICNVPTNTHVNTISGKLVSRGNYPKYDLRQSIKHIGTKELKNNETNCDNMKEATQSPGSVDKPILQNHVVKNVEFRSIKGKLDTDTEIIIENNFNADTGVVDKGVHEEVDSNLVSNQKYSDIQSYRNREVSVMPIQYTNFAKKVTNKSKTNLVLHASSSSITAYCDSDVVQTNSYNSDHENLTVKSINREDKKCYEQGTCEYESLYTGEKIKCILSDDENSDLEETIVSVSGCEIIDDFDSNIIHIVKSNKESIQNNSYENSDATRCLQSDDKNNSDFDTNTVYLVTNMDSNSEPADDCCENDEELVILNEKQEHDSNKAIEIDENYSIHILNKVDESVPSFPSSINEDTQKININSDNDELHLNSINSSKNDSFHMGLNVFSTSESKTLIDKNIVIYDIATNNMTDFQTEHDEDTSLSTVTTIDSPNQLIFEKDCELKGIEYNDPELGTCYVFNVAETISTNLGTTDVIHEIPTSINEVCDESISFVSKTQHDSEFNFDMTVPLITYSRKLVDQEIQSNSNGNKDCRRALKRKSSSTDTRVEKRFRKGKHIDYPKFTTSAISESAYGKEYKRLMDYSSSIKFSYSRPFHIDNIDVTELLKKWPIKGAVNVDLTLAAPDETLFIDLEDICNPKIILDPTIFTLSQEINAEYQEEKSYSDKTKETNFNMGFGEESGRVLKNLDDGGDVTKFSAAALSDVKQNQPFLQSEDCENNRQYTSRTEQIHLLKKYLNIINMKQKVKDFFKKTSFDLNQNWIKENKKKCYNYRSPFCHFPFDLNSTEFFEATSNDFAVNVVQVGQLPVSAAAQNPVTCDPRVTQVSDASPSQCSAENTSSDDPQSVIKTEYTELTTADLSLPLQDYSKHERSVTLESQETSNLQMTKENIPIETEIKSVVKIELIEELPEDKEELIEPTENIEILQEKQDISNVDYSFDTGNIHTSPDQTNFQMIFHANEKQNMAETYSQPKQDNGSSEKSDQIAHAMNAAGITTNTDTMSNTRAQALVNILSQKIRQEAINVNTSQSTTNTFSKPPINAMALQQALAQILPPPLNQTSSESNQQTSNSSVTSQVLHIVQGKNTSGNQITLVDNSQQPVINSSNSTPVLHIVQNKAVTAGPTSTANPTAPTNTFSGISLVDTGLQQGGNQLLHIVNTGNQKTNNSGQLLKRVNLLTNLANVQGSNEQKMVQFVCKSADGKAIQLNAPHQRSMVLRLQPIETPNIHQANVQKPLETSEISSNSVSAVNKEAASSQQEIKSRSVYEENYAKFIQNASTKPVASEKSTSLPKFNQAFGKQIFQDGNQKNEINNGGNTHMPTTPVNNSENLECQQTDNSINLEHINQISSPPLLLRKTPVSTSQATQPNLVQQIKQTIAPMNLQTMHGGVIYTRQIPVNIGGGQTINLITVPSTELIDDNIQKQQSDVKFVNQGEIEPSIIKIVPQTQPVINGEVGQDDNNSHLRVSNENNHTPQPQPVLTQMRIKLPMLSKTPQMVSGARVVRPSFFQIQRNVIGGANQPVYQQLVLTAAPQLGQQTIRLPQTQTRNPVKVPSETQSSTETQMSSSTLEQLREFDLVLEQVKERSTVQPNSSSSNTFSKLHSQSTDTTDGSASVSSTSTDSAQQVLYSIGNNQPMNVTYVNRKETATTPTTSTFIRSPDSSGIADSPTSSSHVQIPHTVTSESSTSDTPAQSKPKVSSKSKSRPKSSNPPNTLKLNTVPPKTSTQKPLEDEQTTQRILYILAEYKEQVENSPDKDKPAPRRRSNPPSNPSGSSKRKKSSSGSRRPGRDLSPVHGDDTCRTMGSEDSSCGTSQGDCNESCLDSHSPQDSPRKVVRKLTFEHETPVVQPRPQPQRNVIVADGQTITVARGTTGKPATAVLMPANYILPVSMVKGGQQIAIVTNRGPKLLTVGGGEGGATNALLLQRLIGPAGLKPVLARPGVRHVRLPTAALHNLQAFNFATATTIQPPDSTASPAPAPTPPDLVETRAASSPWTDRESQDVKPERGSSPEGSEPWNLPSSADPHDYSYEETVPADSMNRTVLDPIPDRYSPDMEAQRIFDKMFDVDSKKSYIVDSPRCGYDIDTSDCDDKGYHQKKDGTSHRQQRLTHVSAAALRHKYAILEHELRLQKSLSEECEDLGVDSPSASELFPEAELLFAASPAHDHTQDQGIHSHTPQPTLINQSSIPQPDMDDQIATDQLLTRADDLQDRHDLNLGLEDVGIVTVSEDGMQATIALDQEEFARSHPNTTFHSEPTDDVEVQPFTLSGIKGRHITSTIFHNRAPSTVLMNAPQTTVISQATGESSGVQNAVKYSDIDNMINSLPSSHTNSINLSSVLVKDDGLTRFDSILNDSRELHLSNTASAIVHSAGNATQVIRRVCYDDDKRDSRFLIDEPDALIAGDDAKMIAEDSSREALDSIVGDDDRSSPERHTELFWESNSASERSESRRPLDFSSDSDKCCKSPSFDETNSTDSSGVGTHMRLDSVIKEARGVERSGSADGSSADDTHPPLRTYPPKRMYHTIEGEMERSMSGKTRAGERSPDSLEVRRRASGRGVVKRGCHCCNGSPAPPRPKKSRQRKPAMDFSSNN